MIAVRGFALAFAIVLLASSTTALACTEEVEPNDTPATATPLGDAYCFEGTAADRDQDAFRWDATAADVATRWRVRVESSGGGGLRLDTFRITFAENGVDVTDVSNFLTLMSVDGRTVLSEPFLVLQDTLIFGVSATTGGKAYRVTLEREDDLSLSHDEVGDAQGVFSVRGRVDDSGARRVPWRVDATLAETRWRLDAQVALGVPLRLELVRADGTSLAATGSDGVARASLTNLALDAGDYVVVLHGADAEVPFTLQASLEDAVEGDAEREPNDDPESAHALDVEVVTHGRVTQGDVDFFTFEVAGVLAEQLFDLVIVADGVVEVALYDDGRRLLQERRGSGGALRSLRMAPGTYGFVIRSPESVTYALSFRRAGSPQTGREEEPNDTPASAQRLDDSLTIRGELTGRDVDVFRFSVPPPGALYRVQVVGREPGIARVFVSEAGGSVIVTQDVEASARNARLDDVDLPAGEYLLTIEGEGAEYAVRFLDLRDVVDRPAPLQATTTTQSEPLTVTTVEAAPPLVTTVEAAPLTVTAVEAAPPVETVSTPVAPEVAATPPEAPREGPEPGQPTADEPLQRRAEPPPRTRPAEVPVCERPEGSDATGTLAVRYAIASALACGDDLNTVVVGDRVGLSDEPAAFRFIWVAASQRGTVIKIDTDTGEVKGEYWTAPVFDPEAPSSDPSRTVVDRNGNAWVGNRSDVSNGDGLWQGSVVQIGLLENGQCHDRNGDGVIETSVGLGDVLPWTNAADADRSGGVSTAVDECILRYVHVDALGVRHLSVDQDGDVWIAGTWSHVFQKLDARSGEIVRTEAFGCGGYGGLIDRSGTLWGAFQALRWPIDDAPMQDSAACLEADSYGLALDRHDRVWATDFKSGVCRLDALGHVDACFEPAEPAYSSRGVAVTDDDHVWVAYSRTNVVVRFAPDGAEAARVDVGVTPTGVAVDARGKVWVTNLESHDVMRIDPATNQVDLTVSLGDSGDPDTLPFRGAAGPYTYSDMTGSLVFGPPDSGTWTLQVPGPSYGTRWTGIRFDALVPAGAEARVRVAARGGAVSSGREVRSGDALDLEGPMLTIEVTMTRGSDGASPTFGALEIDLEGVPLAPGAISVRARPDLVAASNAIAVILDASGSMGVMLAEGVSRWRAATNVLLDLADRAFPVGVPLSLRVYGHQEPITCHTSLELPSTPFDPERFRATVSSLEPKLLSGTPLAESIEAAGQDLAGRGGRMMVLLLTDGEESCGGDPGGAIDALRARLDVTVNIVGFALAEGDAVRAQFARWAESTGGVYIDTQGSAELAAAIERLLQPEFVVVDMASGEEVARGSVNLGAVEVPSGLYSVRVLSTPEKRIDGVRVVEQDVTLTVALRE